MNGPLENQTNNVTTHNVVSGNDIMSYSPEAIQEKRMTIATLIEKINANNVIGEIVDDYEKERSESIAKQKEQIQKEQLEKEAQIRQELEEQRLLEEEQTKQEEAEKTNFSDLIADIAKKTKKELFHSKLIKKITKQDDIPEECPEKEEVETSIDENVGKTKKELFLSKKKKKIQKEESTNEAESEETPKEKIQKQRHLFFTKKTKSKEQQKPIKEQPSSSKKVAISYGEEVIDEIIEEPEETVVEKKKKTPEEIKTEADKKREAIRNDVIRAHESTSIDEVYRFRCALERLSEDSYNLTYVYAACIIDKDFESISIIRNVMMLAELIGDSGDSLDFYFAYIITNKGVQHYGCDEALSDVTLAIEDIRSLFLQKKGKVTPDQLQALNSLRIFKTIYYEDSGPRMRR